MTEIKPGWWRMRNGCVALVTHRTYDDREYVGLSFDERKLSVHAAWMDDGRCALMILTEAGMRKRDLLTYLGTDMPTDWYVEQVKEKTWRPWTWEEMVSHQNAWFSYYSDDVYIWNRVEAVNDRNKMFRIDCSWVNGQDLLDSHLWRMLPGDEPQRCGVEE